jgi:hypothetical protein
MSAGVSGMNAWRQAGIQRETLLGFQRYQAARRRYASVD